MIEELWRSAAAAGTAFDPARLGGIPAPARRYLEHAIASGTPLASAVRLRMRGEIKLGRWLPFQAEQIICAERGFVWHATVRRFGIPLIDGFDRLVDGAGEMRWKLLGLVPVMTASGPDITRSAIGRMRVESIWLPSLFARENVRWAAPDRRGAAAIFGGDEPPVELDIDGRGRVQAIRRRRWGNPGGGAFRLVEFGGVLEREAAFGAYVIPTRVRAGWYFGTARFEADGEFFRASIDDATFR